MKRYQLLTIFICITLLQFLVLVQPVSAESNPAPVIEVTAEILHCNLQQGWCSSMPQVELIASASGTTIQAIQGRLNGVPFISDGAKMILDLAAGHNQISYWAVSSSDIRSARHFLDLSMEERNVLATAFNALSATSPSSGSGRSMTANVFETASGSVLEADSVLTSTKGQLQLTETQASIALKTDWKELKKLAWEPPKSNSRLIAYLFTQLVGRKKVSLVSPVASQGDSKSYSLVLEDTPPKLSIQPQTSFSGRLAFSGTVTDDLSGMKSLMKRINDGWQTLTWQDSTWKFFWDTERERISSGEFTLQLLAEDVAGNTQTASLQFHVLNRIWPFVTLWVLLLALALTAVLNPRRKAWREFTAFVYRMTELGLVDYFKEEE